MTVDPETFEASDEQVEVERRPRAGVVVSIRLSAEEADRLQELAAERNMTLSRLGREAIVHLLGEGVGQRSERPLVGLSWTVMSTYPSHVRLVPEPQDPLVATSGHLAAHNAPAGPAR